MDTLLRNYFVVASVLMVLSRSCGSNSDFHSKKVLEKNTNEKLGPAAFSVHTFFNNINPEGQRNQQNISNPEYNRTFKIKNRYKRSEHHSKMSTYTVEDGTRRKRFYPYPSQVVRAPPIQSFTYFDTAPYEIQRPYIIPIWGAPNRVPIYFPPQPVYSNPGFPIHNQPYQLKPNRGYLPIPPPRGYLPPSTEVPTDTRYVAN